MTGTIFLPAISRHVLALAALAGMLCFAPVGASGAACDWAAAKADIDLVLDGDQTKSQAFRSLTANGKDSEDALLALASDEVKSRLRACGYEAAEYLTKRGFPPLH